DVKRCPYTLVWGGLDPMLESGDRWTVILDISGNYVPPIEPGKPHRIELRINRYASNPIGFPAEF
ncbi:MAG: hypothetical protein NTU83_12695, partial [Candidatus Hydrogenedentes bacterium]|nr:hypothetical protein [Candidatus Hydrogenedentota bacterium]